MATSPNRPRAIVLLSGGLDSVAATYMLRHEVELVLALTADYGQRASRRELGAAYAVAMDLEIHHRTIFLPFLKEAARGALVDRSQPLPTPDAAALSDPSQCEESAEKVWVPNRNGALIAMAASWAESMDVPHIICGFNREEAETFPDNSQEFVTLSNQALALSTRNKVSVLAPTINMSKVEIAKAAQAAGAPLHLMWSCYDGEDSPCGVCESCIRFRRALDGANIAHRDGIPG